MTSTTATPFTSYVSVMPRGARPAELDTALLRAAGMTDRALIGSPLVYIFTTTADRFDAMEAVAALIGSTGTVVDHGTATAGAMRVAIDPALVA